MSKLKVKKKSPEPNNCAMKEKGNADINTPFILICGTSWEESHLLLFPRTGEYVNPGAMLFIKVKGKLPISLWESNHGCLIPLTTNYFTYFIGVPSLNSTICMFW